MNTLVEIAQEFSPRYERHRDDLVSIDVRGLERLVGTPRTIGEELRREAAAHGVGAHVAIAATRITALVLAQARPGLTVVEPGGEAAALAPLPVGLLERIDDPGTRSTSLRSPALSRASAWQALSTQRTVDQKNSASTAVSAFKRWGIRTLGELAALPPDDLASRLGQTALVWHAIARGDDVRPLVPTLPEEPFASSLDLDWPIEGLEPLSFVLTRLLEPLSIRLERHDRGAAVLHIELGLVPPDGIHARHLQLPSPIRDVRTLRTLALLDLDAHPPPAAIDRVAIVIDPTPGRVLQHALFTRAHPTPDQLSTLVARLGALMGHDRVGRPASVDSYRPGAFDMQPFATDHDHGDHDDQRRNRGDCGEEKECYVQNSAISALNAGSALNVVSALRRCRQPVPARVALTNGRPARVTTDRRAWAGGAVVGCAGPWRTSGDWWAPVPWSRDEWDVALKDGAVYRVFRDCDTDRWFIDAIAD